MPKKKRAKARRRRPLPKTAGGNLKLMSDRWKNYLTGKR